MAATNSSAAPMTLQSQFEGSEAATHGIKWDELYQRKFTPWDRGFAHPALEDLLAERKDIIGESWVVDPVLGKRRKRALVPGCGKGYDVLLLSAFGYDAYGLDISENGVEAARETEKTAGNEALYQARDNGVGKGRVTWLAGDFFKEDFVQGVDGDGTFDLLWDYTFLSALPPSLRPAWALRFTQLLAREGVLICAEFPTYKSPNTGGPPWALPPKVYAGHLPRPGQDLPYDDDKGLLEDKLGPVSKDGLEQVEHFKPRRSHEAGIIDGEITDFIGVWKHRAISP